MDELAALTRRDDDDSDKGGHDTDDELGSVTSDHAGGDTGGGGKLRQGGSGGIARPPPLSSARNAAPPPLVEHSGRRTGPKGVVDDARAANAAAREAQREAVARTRKEQERRALVAPSYAEEEARAGIDALRLESKPAAKSRGGTKGTRDNDGGDAYENEDDEDEYESELRARRIAALTRASVREVSGAAYLSAIERPGWVLAAIYEPDMERCDALLTQLATTGVPAVRARASRIGFSLLPDSVTSRVDAQDEDEREPQSDPDVLPTLLAYRSGNLVHNWVRVDLEPVYAAEGLRALLGSEGVVAPN